MFERCAGCGGRILAGGEEFAGRRFCGEACLTGFQVQLVDEMLSADLIAEHVEAAFRAPCPQCGETSGNGIHASTKLTGMLILYRVESGSVLCCTSCARKNRFTAALHCFFLGWWSIRSAFMNVFVLPTNVLRGVLVQQPLEPSAALTTAVKVQLASAMEDDLAAALDAAATQDRE